MNSLAERLFSCVRRRIKRQNIHGWTQRTARAAEAQACRRRHRGLFRPICGTWNLELNDFVQKSRCTHPDQRLKQLLNCLRVDSKVLAHFAICSWPKKCDCLICFRKSSNFTEDVFATSEVMRFPWSYELGGRSSDVSRVLPHLFSADVCACLTATNVQMYGWRLWRRSDLILSISEHVCCRSSHFFVFPQNSFLHARQQRQTPTPKAGGPSVLAHSNGGWGARRKLKLATCSFEQEAHAAHVLDLERTETSLHVRSTIRIQHGCRRQKRHTAPLDMP
jgi:hypothetical protein